MPTKAAGAPGVGYGSGESRVGVRCIFAKARTSLFEVAFDLPPPYFDEGADDSAVFDGMNRSKSAGARTAEKAQEKRLRLIVEGMAYGDSLRAELCRLGFEELVAGVPALVLDRALAFACALGHVGTARCEGKRQPFRERAAERLVLFGLRAKAVVQVGENQRDPEARFQLEEELRERDRIRASGKADEHPVARMDHSVSLDGPDDFRRQHRSRTPLLRRKNRTETILNEALALAWNSV